MKKPLSAIIFLFLSAGFNNLLAQGNFPGSTPPIITYPGPQTFTVGTPIAPPVTPINQGGVASSFTLGGAPVAFATNVNCTGLTIDASGNFYSTDGTNNLINKVSPAGVVTILAGSGVAGSANGTGTAASFNNPQGIGIDGTGNLYVADVGNNLIRKITPAGVVTTFAGSGAAGSNDGVGTAASFNQPTGIAIDGAGNIYVADTRNYLIRKITPAGVVTTFAGSGTSASVDGTGTGASFIQPNSLAIDASGNLYVGDVVQVRTITPAEVVTTLAGSDTFELGSADGNGAAATFSFAGNMTVDQSGNVYVAEPNNNDIRKITGNTVTTYSIINSGVAGGITIDASGNLYIGTGSGLNKIITTLPPGIVFDGSTGAISGTPTATSPPIIYTVEAFDFGGSSVTTVSIAVNNLAPVISYPQSPLTATSSVAFSISPVYTGGAPSSYTVSTPLPAGISLNGLTGVISGTPSAASPSTSYNIIALNSGGNDTTTINITVKNQPPAPIISYAGPKTYTVGAAITPLSPSSTGGAVPPAISVSTFAGSGAFGSANGPSLTASFSNPAGVALGALGDLYVADYSDNLIRKINVDGVVSTFASGFNGPGGLAIDASGNVFVADVNNNVIEKITPAGIESVFSNGQGDPNCRLCPHGFLQPSAVVVDGFGNMLVADYGNHQVDFLAPGGVPVSLVNDIGGVFTPRGLAEDNFGNTYVADPINNTILNLTSLTKFAGSGAAGSANGSGVAASFNGPTGVATDAQGNIYVADAGNNLIRKITRAGVVTTFAGSGVAGSADGRDTLASFNNPYGLAVDPFGVIYVADAGNNLIRKIVPGGYTISPALPAGLVFDSATGTISGTPTSVSPATTYTVVASNAGGSASAMFSITVTSGALNIDSLHNLTISSGSLTPAFASGTTTYAASVGNAVNSITVTPTAVNSAATITVNGTPVPSGSASAAITLSVGANTVTTMVTSQDGTATMTYSIVVTRAPSANAALVHLTISSGTLSPAFTSTTTSYTALVPNATTSITVTPTVADSTATVTVNGVSTLSGSHSASIPLSVGANTIHVIVTAQDGTTTKTYSVIITRTAAGVPDLANLTISSGRLTPSFATTTFNYTATVGRTISSITLTPTARVATFIITVNGTTVPSGSPSPAISLAPGVNIITIDVNTRDGIVTGVYTITVTREGGGSFANANILGFDNFENQTDSLQNDNVLVHPAISPNGDGINDVLTIDNIGNYPDNNVTLIDMSGKAIYKIAGYDNVNKVFNGHSNITGALQQPGTYFYLLEYKVNGENIRKTGFFVLRY